MEKKLTKMEKKKLEKVLSNVQTQLHKLELTLNEVPTFMKGDIWSQYVRISNYKKELLNLINN